MTNPRTYEEMLADGDQWLKPADDWDPMVQQMRGFTASGIFRNPCTLLIDFDGIDYHALNAYQTVYGGPDDAGGVDGAVPAAVVQAALDNMTSGGKLVINCAATLGTKISLSNIDNIVVEGVGESSVLTLADSVNDHMFEFTSCDYFTTRNLALVGNHANQAADYIGIKLNTCDNPRIENCKITDFGYTSIDLVASNYFSILHNRLEGGGLGIRTASTFGLVDGNWLYNIARGDASPAHGICVSGGAGKCHSIKIVNNFVDITTSMGITVDSGSYRCMVSNNYIANTGEHAIEISRGAEPSGDGFVIVGNRILSAGHIGIFVEAVDSTVASNSVISCGWSGIVAYDSVKLSIIGNTVRDVDDVCMCLSGVTHSTISGNVLTDPNYDNDETWDVLFVGCSPITSVESTNLVITNNRCAGAHSRYGIRLEDATDYVTIVGNDLTGNGTGEFSNAGTGTHLTTGLKGDLIITDGAIQIPLNSALRCEGGLVLYSGVKDTSVISLRSGTALDATTELEIDPAANTIALAGNTLKDPANQADGTLGGTPLLVKVYVGATPYYFKIYPTVT